MQSIIKTGAFDYNKCSIRFMKNSHGGTSLKKQILNNMFKQKNLYLDTSNN